MQITLRGAVSFFSAGELFSAELTFATLVQHPRPSYYPKHANSSGVKTLQAAIS
jgi:hypothetical protein